MAFASVLVLGQTQAAEPPGVRIETNPRLDLLQRSSPKTAHGDRKLLLSLTSAGSVWWSVGEFGLALRSTDSGTSWTQVVMPTSAMLTAVTFVDARLGWAVGHDGVILHTADAGTTWNRQFDGNASNGQMHAALKAQLDALTSEKNESEAMQLARQLAEDRLADVNAAIKAGPSRPFMDVRFTNARHGFVVGAFGQIFETLDGGERWTFIGQRLKNPEGLNLTSVQQSPGGSLFVTAEGGVVFRSSDGGQTWLRSNTGYTGYLYGVIPTGTDGVVLVFGFNGNVYRSTDDGQTWNFAGKPANKSLVDGALVGKSKILLAAQDGALIVSEDDGVSFKPLAQKLKQARVSQIMLNAHGKLSAVGVGGVTTEPLSLKVMQP